MAYSIFWQPVTADHLGAIDRKRHGLIRDTVKRELGHEPLVAARNRKPLQKTSPVGQEVWELRFGPGNRFRVFYKAYPAAGRVEILAVGVKERNILRIGREEVRL